MSIRNMVRSVVSSVVALVIALPIIGAGLPTSVAHASAPTLVINEINWAGSAGSPTDQWVEIFNATAAPLNFAITPFTLSLAGAPAPLATLNSGVVAAHGFFLVSRLNPASSSSSLQIPADLVAPTLVLPRVDAQYLLQDQSGSTVDKAGLPTGAPLAGSDGTSGDFTIASMARSTATGDGTLASSWFTPHTIGQGFKASANQYGTPSNSLSVPTSSATNNGNLELAGPTQLTVSPASPSSTASVVVSGKVVVSSGQVMPVYARAHFQHLPDNTIYDSGLATVNSTDGTFSIPMAGMSLGNYHIFVDTQDAAALANHSALMEVPIPNSPQYVYTVNASPTVLAAPVLNAFPPLLNATACQTNSGNRVCSVVLTGSAQAGSSVLVSINGNHYTNDALAPGQTTFSITVVLYENALNQIEVRAKDTTGNTSSPTIANITLDTTSPVLSAAKLAYNVSSVGSADTVSGMAGAVSDSTAGDTVVVEAYSDQALSTKLGSSTVVSDGSFPGIAIGDGSNTTVYLIAKDAAGNKSVVASVNAPSQFTAGQISLNFFNVTTNSMGFKWSPVPGAAYYLIKYKAVGGSFGAEMVQCKGVANCSFQGSIINLLPSTSYTVALAAVDKFGNRTAFTESTMITVAAPAPVVLIASNSTPTNSNEATPTPTPVITPAIPQVTPPATPAPDNSSVKTDEKAATPTPATPADEKGQVKSADTANTPRNWTPWIILGVLIGLAVLATAGYFYWFGGEAGDAVMASAAKEKEKYDSQVVPPGQSASDKKEVIPPKDKKDIDNEKRW